MSRRVPVRAKPSPASQRPEGQAEKKLVQSSRELQSRMRDKATSHAKPSATPGGEPERTTPVQTEEVKVAPEVAAKPVEPQTSQAKPRPARKQAAKPAPASVSKSEERAGGDTERYSLRVPFNLETQNAVAAMAKSYGKDTEYVASALLKQSKTELRNTWEAGDLKTLEASAKLISEQADQQGTQSQIFKATVPTKLVNDARKLFDDPLGLITDNKIVAAFVAASIYEKLKKA